MNFSEWAIRRPMPVIVLFILLTFCGVFAFNQIIVKDFPDLDLPLVTVSVSLTGATPNQLETQVTRKIEDSVANVDSVKHINSTVIDGNSLTTIEFRLEKNLSDAVSDIKDAVTGIKSQFPPGTSEPTITKVNISSGAILTYQVISKNMDLFDLSWLVDNDINKILVSTQGVGKVIRQGGVEREIEILLDPLKLIALNTTINDISDQLHSVRQDFSGGIANIAGSEQTIQGIHDINRAIDIAHLDIPLATGYYVQLASVASVVDTASEVRQMAFFNNKPVISFSIYPSRGASEISVAKLVNEKIALFTASHPNIQIKEIGNIVDPIINNYHASMQALYEGCILAIIVVWLFLRDWRATFVSATALPLSIIPTFLFMYWFGFSLNGVSLLALTLVIGVLVDDAIVEVENIVRHLTYTKSPIDAAINAAKEIGTAVIATSFTLVAVFLPTAFMGGIPGRVFKQFGLTASIAILLSLVVARLITPLMAAYFMRSHLLHEEIKVSKFMHKYLTTVKWCLNNKGKTIALVSVFFMASMLLVIFIPTTFFPAQDNNQVFLNVQVPPGSKIDNMVRVINLAYDKTHDLKSIKSCYATIGVGVQSGETVSADSDVTYGTLVFSLVNSNKRNETQSELEKIIQNRLQTIPGAKFYGGVGNGERYSLILASADSVMLHNTAQAVEKQMRALHDIGNVNSDYDTTRPEIFIKPKFNKSAELGVTPENIGQVIRVATMGDYSNNLAKLDLDSRQIPIKVKLDKTAIQSLDGINNLRIRGNRGTVPLSNVADIHLGNGPVNISRYDRNRSVTFNIDLHGRNISEVDHEINQLPIMKHLPTGVYRVASEDMENMHEMFVNFILAMVTGILCVFFVLILLFNDVKQPITILAALPLAISGAIGGMVIFGYSFSMSSLIGILMLMGIVTKNSILLVDYILKSIREGKNKREAILDACQTRSRPIIMTTIAMIAGMIPIAFGLEGSSGDSSFKVPMAVTVIAGLITSTILSLLVIPVIFEIIDNMSFKNSKKLIKRIYAHRL